MAKSAVDGRETELEHRSAPNKLSKVKKYLINRMSIQDLDVLGREMLGAEFKDTRRKKRDDRLKQLAQIYEAVAYFQGVAKKRRDSLQAFAAFDILEELGVATICSWEAEYADILPRN